MSSSAIVVSRNSAGVIDATTRYFPIVGSNLNGSSTVAAAPPTSIREAGTASNGYIYISSNTASNTSTVTLQENGVDTAVTISIGGDQTGVKEDTSNTNLFAATDEANWEITVPSEAGTNTLVVAILGITFAPTTTTNTLTILGTGQSSIFSSASTTRFAAPSGGMGWITADTNIEYRIRGAFTSSDFYTTVSSNSRTTDIVLGTRKNSGSGNQSVTYAAGETGEKNDTTNTDSLVAGDDYNYYITSGTGTENIQILTVTTTLISTADEFVLLCSGTVGAAVSFNTTTYLPTAGAANAGFTTTEANTQYLPRFTFTAKELGSYVSANTIATSATTVHLMDNGGESSLTVSYAAGETGLKNDSSNTAEITSGTDEIDYRVVTPNTSGSLTFFWIGMLGDTSAGTIRYRRLLASTGVGGNLKWTA